MRIQTITETIEVGITAAKQCKRGIKPARGESVKAGETACDSRDVYVEVVD